MSEIYDKLQKLNIEKVYPFHMPGHKRNENIDEMSGYYDIDITEIDDYDNLHDSEGMIKESEERAGRLYNADETHFLINGSTCGVLSAVSAAVSFGGKILAARNSHKSLYNAAYLRHLEVEYILPEDLGICPGMITAKTVEEAFFKNASSNEKDSAGEAKKIEAVFITSPTYDGVVSPIKEIAEIAHKNGAILIVDEAHGAHFGMDERLPRGAVSEGADIVIHSVHKTLASMTQTGLIHVQGDRVDREKLRFFLRIYQSSSPSYVLMSSIDSCINDLEKRRKEVFDRLYKYRAMIDEGTKACKYIHVEKRAEFDDPCKVLICVDTDGINGKYIYDILRLEYKLQLEMAAGQYALAIITGYDSEEGISRLVDAIVEIDKRIAKELDQSEKKEPERLTADKGKDSSKPELPRKVTEIWQAIDGASEVVDITQVSGRVSGDYINLYPPGIPLVAPGEVIDKDMVKKLEVLINQKMNLQGVDINKKGRWIKVLRRDNRNAAD